uniref:L-gulonolactone oxidase n=1 Tax=Kalanchoe fedtschenkoi TaxID=63787 RepID=A0A7N0UWC5_KALFE
MGSRKSPLVALPTDCTITNSYGAFPDRSICKAAIASYPGTEQELIHVVASATKARAKMKVATLYSHSIPKLVCPDGDEGWLVSTKKLTRVLGVDTANMEMSVESGVTLKQLINAAADAGLALPYSPYWSGLTVGGMLGWADGSSVHDYVVRVRVVSPGSADDGYVKVRDLDTTNNLTDLNAVRTNLGVLGVISQMTFKLQLIFKRSITYQSESDGELAERAVSFGHQHEFADITWYLSQGKAVYRVDAGHLLERLRSIGESGNLAFAGIYSKERQEAQESADGKCVSATITTLALITTAFGLTNINDTFFIGYPVIGYQNRLQSSSSCLEGQGDKTCAWDPRVKGEYFFQTTFSVPLTKVKSFIQDVQRLVKLVPKSMCGMDLYLGILMRSKDPMKPRLFEDVYEEIEQMGIFKYGGLPHWGKNRNLAFIGAFDKYSKGKEFLKIKERYDPLGLFSSEWTDQVLGLKDGLTKDEDGCALEGLSVCSKHTHCAPTEGYYCKPGRMNICTCQGMDERRMVRNRLLPRNGWVKGVVEKGREEAAVVEVVCGGGFERRQRSC